MTTTTTTTSVIVNAFVIVIPSSTTIRNNNNNNKVVNGNDIIITNTLSLSSNNNNGDNTATTSKQVEETDAERMLRKAKELRKQAEQAEHQVHKELVEKKTAKNAELDRLIDYLFFNNNNNNNDTSSLVDRLRNKKLSIETLEAIIVRLDQRGNIANGGFDNIEFKMVDNKVEFYRSVGTEKNEKELQRLQGCIDKFINAVSILDEEFNIAHTKEGMKISYAEKEHWGGGTAALHLQDKVKQIQRERSEQFQQRMDEFKEAQRLKDDDDHKFKGYNDLGTLN